jgi:hypothetical protein
MRYEIVLINFYFLSIFLRAIVRKIFSYNAIKPIHPLPKFTMESVNMNVYDELL